MPSIVTGKPSRVEGTKTMNKFTRYSNGQISVNGKSVAYVGRTLGAGGHVESRYIVLMEAGHPIHDERKITLAARENTDEAIKSALKLWGLI